MKNLKATLIALPAYDSVAGGTAQLRTINARGYGRLTDLGVAASQDLRVDIPTARILCGCDGLRTANDDQRVILRGVA